MSRTRRPLGRLELLIVVTIIAAGLGLLAPAVLKLREVANRPSCQNHLRQLGLALNKYHVTHGCFPPGLVCTDADIRDATATGFPFFLPYLRQEDTRRLYHADLPWFDKANYQAVGTEVPPFYCPSNRTGGKIDLGPVFEEFQTPMPPFAASLDYAFCRGANGAMHREWTRIPAEARGVFHIVPDPADTPRAGVRLADVRDGTSATFAMGDAAGGTPHYLVRDLKSPDDAPVIHYITGKPVQAEQAWAAAGTGWTTHPYYCSVFAVTAQYGVGPDPRPEPMNRRTITPAVWGDDPRGDNQLGKDYLSGFRSLHPGGCNFLMCDGAVRFVAETIRPAAYMALSTYMGGDQTRSDH